ncbi:MAG: hypothetical protein J6A33_04725 [Alphaproteobacteria bacterium]|nr:hypothetical protein [Alphaproteobacteria bacterium]
MILLLCIMFLSGCASGGNYEQSMQKWMGVSQEALYYSWGEPDNILTVTPNEMVVTYIQTENEAVDGNTEPYADDEVYYPAIETPNYGTPDNEQNAYYCKTSFTIVNNVVVNYTFSGDDCVTED